MKTIAALLLLFLTAGVTAAEKPANSVDKESELGSVFLV